MDESYFSVSHCTTEEGEVLGFYLKFPNKYSISVIFGGHAMSDDVYLTQVGEKFEYSCSNAEIAVINPEGEIVPFTENALVKGNVTPEQLPQIIFWAMSR
jgi:hypothetical protein